MKVLRHLYCERVWDIMKDYEISRYCYKSSDVVAPHEILVTRAPSASCGLCSLCGLSSTWDLSDDSYMSKKSTQFSPKLTLSRSLGTLGRLFSLSGLENRVIQKVYAAILKILFFRAFMARQKSKIVVFAKFWTFAGPKKPKKSKFSKSLHILFVSPYYLALITRRAFQVFPDFSKASI